MEPKQTIFKRDRAKNRRQTKKVHRKPRIQGGNSKVLKENMDNYESKIVTSEEELLELANKGYECQVIGANKWLMRRKLLR